MFVRGGGGGEGREGRGVGDESASEEGEEAADVHGGESRAVEADVHGGLFGEALESFITSCNTWVSWYFDSSSSYNRYLEFIRLLKKP